MIMQDPINDNIMVGCQIELSCRMGDAIDFSMVPLHQCQDLFVQPRLQLDLGNEW